jgi:broad specificity phosphatase PhoE
MKLYMLRAVVVVLAVASAAGQAWAQQSVFLVRHAERADSVPGEKPTMANDPDLSDVGRARAQSLAAILKDAKIAAIYTTEYKRTQQTAAPLATALGLTPTTIKAAETARLVKELAASKGNVLVVGHSNTVPDVIKGLGVTNPDAIKDDEFDNLFILTPGSPPAVVKLHYK